ncbi:MAG: tRNA guanosine(34) transglycosylase Tgt [Candidatus Peregrinibacteria bacterium]
MSFFTIQSSSQKSRARAGIIHTLHGHLKTPCFMTVGTKANVKTVSSLQLQEIGVPVVLCNTYHLHLLPGEDLIAEMGGLHGFMHWDKPIFTDSGGYQVFSMGHGSVSEEIKGIRNHPERRSLLKISEDGAVFRSYLDGSQKVITPESSIQIQHKLGADMIAVFDECTPFHVEKTYTRKSMEMTHRWLDRCIAEHKRLNSQQALYGIIQGGVYEDLREISTDYISKSETPGICIGGSLGQTKEQMYEVVDFVSARLPKEKPVHLLGIGDLDDIVRGVAMGMDSFDCVAPTRNARHGRIFSSEIPNKKMQITNAAFRHDTTPLDKNCDCRVCQNYSKSYIHYLFRAKEALGMQLCSYHNISFLTRFMERIRESVLEGRFEAEFLNA